MQLPKPTSCIVAIVVSLLAPAMLPAQPDPTTRSALDELNRQTTALYHQVQTGIYRVRLPQPKWVNAYAMAGIDRWNEKLAPAVRERLEREVRLAVQGTAVPAGPSTRPSDDTTTIPGQGTFIVIRSRADAQVQSEPIFGGKLQPDAKLPPQFSANNIGVLIDEEGHVLVPLYVEREATSDQPIQVAGPDGTTAEARFVGSDRQTNLTLLQIDKPTAKPVTLASARPEAGSLVLCLAPNDGSGRLGLWTDGGQENGIIVNTGGQIAGVARSGQFLTGSACALIARQLIRYGSVKRATLGVLVTEIRQDDPLRGRRPALGKRSAMRVDQVIAGSVAEKAGLREGDLVLAISGEPVGDIPSFAAAIAARNGDTKLRIIRDDKALTLTVDLQQQK